MSIARCDTCHSLVDCDEDPATPQEDDTFKCAWCRGEIDNRTEAARMARLYKRLAKRPTHTVTRRTYNG